MASTYTTARPYALAAFKQAQEEGKVGEWTEMLALLARVASDPLMKGLVANPKVNDEQLAALIIDVCGDALSDTGRNFVRVLAEYGRIALLADIERIFASERDVAEGRSQVEVTSAFELSDGERKAIADAMSRKLGTEVNVSVEVDPKLIGGAVVRAGDLVIDGSLRGRLGALAQSLAR